MQLLLTAIFEKKLYIMIQMILSTAFCYNNRGRYVYFSECHAIAIAHCAFQLLFSVGK